MINGFSCSNIYPSSLIPLENLIDNVITINNHDFIVRSRTEKGWTIDMVFNCSGYTWVDNSIFYYIGIKNENLPENYIDNNLSFSFTSDKKIEWKTYKFQDNQNILLSDTTPSLCENGINGDFNISVTFERDFILNDCDLLNNGGVNDLVTKKNITNSIGVVNSGLTEHYSYEFGLGKKWSYERKSRLGTLKIYFNGNPIYKNTEWEEIIPSQRNSSNQLIQTWGTGTTGCNDIHNGSCDFEIKKLSYYETPLGFLQIKNIFKDNSESFNFTLCSECNDNILPL